MKRVIILVGLKGSGKSTIGSLVQEKTGTKFFRIENIWLSLKSKRFSSEYFKEGFSTVENEIDKLLSSTDRLIIESTGTTADFFGFLENLKKKYDVKLIKIHTSPETCKKRIKSRDATIHIPVSDDRVEEINRKAQNVELEFDSIIDNENSSNDEILKQLHEFL
jgi:shikimate kinase